MSARVVTSGWEILDTSSPKHRGFQPSARMAGEECPVLWFGGNCISGYIE